MILEGVILQLGITDANGYIFSKDCKIDYPENVIVANRLEEPYDVPEPAIGVCAITRKADNFIAHADVLEEYLDDTHDGKHFVACFFDRVKTKKMNYAINITEARLRYVALIPEEDTVNELLYLTKVAEE